MKTSGRPRQERPVPKIKNATVHFFTKSDKAVTGSVTLENVQHH